MQLTLPLLQTCASEMDDASLSVLIRRYPWSLFSPLPKGSSNVSGIVSFLLDALVRYFSCEELVPPAVVSVGESKPSVVSPSTLLSFKTSRYLCFPEKGFLFLFSLYIFLVFWPTIIKWKRHFSKRNYKSKFSRFWNRILMVSKNQAKPILAWWDLTSLKYSV